jgi:hypothetical protein
MPRCDRGTRCGQARIRRWTRAGPEPAHEHRPVPDRERRAHPHRAACATRIRTAICYPRGRRPVGGGRRDGRPRRGRMGLGQAGRESSARSRSPTVWMRRRRAVEEAIRAANARRSSSRPDRRGRQMGTTLVALVVKGSRYRVLLGRRQPGLPAARRRVHATEPRPYPGAGDGRPRADGARPAGRPPDEPHPLARGRRARDRSRSTMSTGRWSRATSSCCAATACTAMSART